MQDVSVKTSSWTSARGEKLFLRAHTPKDPKGLLVFLHGMHSHSSEKPTMALIEAIAEQGYTVLAYDQHAHGRSATPEKRGNMLDWNFLVDDAVEFMIEYASGKNDEFKHELPFFIGGVSMGGCVSLLASHRVSVKIDNGDLTDFSVRFRGAILLAPALYTSIEPSWIEKQALLTVAWLGGGALRLGPGPEKDPLQPDEEYQEYLKDEYCYTGNMHLSLGRNMMGMMNHAKTILADVKFPFLVCHAKEDPVVKCSGSEELFKDSKSTIKEKRFYENLPTHLVENKPIVIKDSWEWMNTRIQ
mmetsp:Transcript_9925/g.11018  ORF Transcript_9925/g.11018 Transcript_9925/m.11018 type:complete len:301 (-) Transcript_9925:42-944(-)